MRIKHPIKHFSRHSGELRPIPVRHGELPVSAQLPNGLFESTEIATMPNIEPPVSVRAIQEMDESVAKPVLWVVGWQSKHDLDALGIAHKRLFPLRTGDIMASKTCVARSADGWEASFGST